MGQIVNINLLRDIAKQLKALRTEYGLSQEDVYNETGIHIGRIESAKSNISVSTLEALCKYYNTTLQDFFLAIKN